MAYILCKFLYNEFYILAKYVIFFCNVISEVLLNIHEFIYIPARRPFVADVAHRHTHHIYAVVTVVPYMLINIVSHEHITRLHFIIIAAFEFLVVLRMSELPLFSSLNSIKPMCPT